ncbi:zonular occludens toxin domain-containing protein [Snodgrassella sp. CFCC 13594]|uniref:zonular occludens toxin domain-containing protein n=1 Tax=Snodgrassella sp. CFCC 13594 TaxID=1775559 RepID=UPI0009EE89CA|nr:zonular occludens toxin domain-containing protein [Snodgrassella sp. CFCC 13594]
MIYLFTGNMGTGKTSKVVSMILKNEDGLFKMKMEDGTEVPRPLYFCHIDGLDKKKFCAHELSEEQIQSAPLVDVVGENAVLIVDEAHYTYPTRSAGSKPPPYVQKLTELRHDGNTLILMTQHPMQIDVFVRNLVSVHYHFDRKSIGNKMYKKYGVMTSLENPASIPNVESSNWKPPKEAFKYYKSATSHQKFRKKVPTAVWVLVLLLVLIGWKGFSVYQAHKPKEEQAATISASAPGTMDEALVPATGTAGNTSLMPEMYVPKLAEKPESKPLYDTVRKVQNYERIAACIKGGKSGCTCYSDQATPLKEVTNEMCLKYATDGMPFDPFRAPAQQQQSASGSGNNTVGGQQVTQIDSKSPEHNLMPQKYAPAD